MMNMPYIIKGYQFIIFFFFRHSRQIHVTFQVSASQLFKFQTILTPFWASNSSWLNETLGQVSSDTHQYIISLIGSD